MIKSHIKAATACAVVAVISLAGSTALARGGWPDPYESERYSDYHDESGSGYGDWDSRGLHEPAPYHGGSRDDYRDDREVPRGRYGGSAPRWEDADEDDDGGHGYAHERYERRYPPRYGREQPLGNQQGEAPAQPEPADFAAAAPRDDVGLRPALPLSEPVAEPPKAELAAARPASESSLSMPAPAAPAAETSVAELAAAVPALEPSLSTPAAVAPKAETPAAEFAKPALEAVAPPAVADTSNEELPALSDAAEAPTGKIVDALPTESNLADAAAAPGASEELPALIDAAPAPMAKTASAVPALAKDAPLATCDQAVKGERFTVSKVDSAVTLGDGWEVRGHTNDGLNFTCRTNGKGQIALLDIDDLASN